MYGIQCAGRSILHLVERWKSDALLASQRLPVIHFLIHNCSANVNIQVILFTSLVCLLRRGLVLTYIFHVCGRVCSNCVTSYIALQIG